MSKHNSLQKILGKINVFDWLVSEKYHFKHSLRFASILDFRISGKFAVKIAIKTEINCFTKLLHLKQNLLVSIFRNLP